METEESQLAQLAALRSDAARKGKDFEDHKRPRTDAGPGADADSSRRAFYRWAAEVGELGCSGLCDAEESWETLVAAHKCLGRCYCSDDVVR